MEEGRRVVTYTVHERGGASGTLAERADAIAFVKEGFAWLALFFPLLWLLYYRMWIVLAGFVGIIAVMETGLTATGLVDGVAAWATILLTLVFAVQANDLRRWSLARKGYRLFGPVTGPSLAACEARFFDVWLKGQEKRENVTPALAKGKSKIAPAANPRPRNNDSTAGDDVIGLFPDPNP